MKLNIGYLLLHDQKFSGWRLDDFVFQRYHFAKDYAERVGKMGNNVVLFTFHQDLGEVKEFCLDGYTLKVFPVKFRFPPLALIGNSHNLEIIKELGDFEIVHFHNYYFWSFALMLFAKRRHSGWRLVAQYHGEPELQTIGKFVHRPFFGVVDKFLVASNEEIYWLRRLRVDQNKILNFPNVGVDTSQFRRLSEKEDVPHFIYAGRMTLRPRTLKEQNPWFILEIVRRLRKKYGNNFKVLMVGDGPGFNALKSFSRNLGLEENVKFLGFVPHHLLPNLYSKCILAFAPTAMSDLNPLWGGALKEALACETAVAGFNAYVKSYWGAKRRFGLLLPTDADKAAEFLCMALKDWDFLVKAGVFGKRFIAEYCSWEKVVERLLEIYRSLLSSFKMEI
ncbi:MAG: glycosyltransferase family 4 protein [Candidatus Bathyarchaeia archaeon]